MLTLSREDSQTLAKHIVEELVTKLSDEDTVEAVSKVWGKHLDMWIGRGFRRFAFYVIMAALVGGAVKFHIWTYLFE